MGVKHGDKVALMLPNCEEFLYAWFGLNKIGAVEVPINVALKGTGLVHQIVQSDSVVLVADTVFLDRLGPVSDDLSSVNHTVFYNTTDEQNLPTWKGIESSFFA
jgi:crotonobetaine/carnitine-CoA ligase